MQSASMRPDHGVSLALLTTTVLPVTSAAATGPPASAKGKLNGAITAQTPYGRITLRLRETVVLQRIVRQRDVEAVVRLEIVGVEVEEVGGLLRLAQRLHAVLADLERERRGDVVDARSIDQSRDLLQQAHALGDGGAAPAGNAACAAANAAFDVLGVGERELAR